jgi:hypothetical protein
MVKKRVEKLSIRTIALKERDFSLNRLHLLVSIVNLCLSDGNKENSVKTGGGKRGKWNSFDGIRIVMVALK